LKINIASNTQNPDILIIISQLRTLGNIYLESLVKKFSSLEIVLPEYKEKDELERKLRIAISEGQGSFMLS